MNADQLIPILKTLQSQAAPGAFQEAIKSLSSIETPQKEAKKEETPDAPVKSKKTLSPEHLEKLKAGREAAKAKKAQEAEEKAKKHLIFDDEPAAEAATAAEPKKRGPKKLSEMTAEELEAHKAKVAERKAKKSSDSDADAEASGSDAEKPKEKRPLNAYMRFSQEQVAPVWRAAGLKLGAASGFPQFAAFLWEQTPEEVVEGKKVKNPAKWTAEAIEAVRADWKKPEVSKLASKKKAVKSEVKLIEGESYVVLANGAAYRHEPAAEEGELGEYVGIFKDGTLDTSAAEPK
jgi:hypothetical protein